MKMNNLSAQHVEVQNNRVRNDAKDATASQYNKNKTYSRNGNFVFYSCLCVVERLPCKKIVNVDGNEFLIAVSFSLSLSLFLRFLLSDFMNANAGNMWELLDLYNLLPRFAFI